MNDASKAANVAPLRVDDILIEGTVEASALYARGYQHGRASLLHLTAELARAKSMITFLVTALLVMTVGIVVAISL